MNDKEKSDVEIFDNDMFMYLDIFCEENNIQDMRKESQSVWNSCLRFIYKNTFKGKDIFKSKNLIINNNNKIASNYNRYDYDKLLEILDIYIYEMCMKYDKEVSIIGFSTLTGIEVSTIYNWGNESTKLSTLSLEIFQKLKDFREESLSNKIVSGKCNPVGPLAALNRHYGWNMGQPRGFDGTKHALSASELPRLGETKDVNVVAEIPVDKGVDVI